MPYPRLFLEAPASLMVPVVHYWDDGTFAIPTGNRAIIWRVDLEGWYEMPFSETQLLGKPTKSYRGEEAFEVLALRFGPIR